MANEIKDFTSEIYQQIISSLDSFEKEIKTMCGISDEDGKWLDTRQVCELLGIKISTLNTYRNRRIIPYSRFGNKCYYKIADIEAMLKKSTKNEKGGNR